MLSAEVIAYLAGADRAIAGRAVLGRAAGLWRLAPQALSCDEEAALARLGRHRFAQWFLAGVADLNASAAP